MQEEACGLSPHPYTFPHYVTPRDGLPTLCDVSHAQSKERGLGWAGMPKPKAQARKRTRRKTK